VPNFKKKFNLNPTAKTTRRHVKRSKTHCQRFILRMYNCRPTGSRSLGPDGSDEDDDPITTTTTEYEQSTVTENSDLLVPVPGILL